MVSELRHYQPSFPNSFSRLLVKQLASQDGGGKTACIFTSVISLHAVFYITLYVSVAFEARLNHSEGCCKAWAMLIVSPLCVAGLCVCVWQGHVCVCGRAVCVW